MTLRSLLARTLNRLRHPSPFMVMGVLLVVSASFTLAQSAKAAGLGLFDFDSVTIFIGQILLTLVGLIGNLLLAAITQLLAVAAYNDFGNASAVVKGWVIVRDLANMTFIVFLLIISFGTILRIEQYRYNQLLGKLLLMAVLINFSKLITLFFIDGAQVVMLTFVSAFKDAAAGNLTTAFGLSDSLKFLANDTSVVDVSARSILVTVLLALALYIIALIVVVVILVVLVIRVFALWVLIILSPMAYALRAFPNTRSQSTKWWSEFGKYVTTGPIIAFFLWLALSVMAGGSLTKGFDVSMVTNKSLVPGAEPTTQLTAALSNISSTEKLLSFMLAIAFLLMGLSTAQGLGGAAGKLAGDWSDKIKKGGLKAAGVLSGAAAVGAVGSVAGAGVKAFAGNRLDWLERKTGLALRPSEWKKGIEEVQEEHHRESVTQRNRKAQDRLVGSERKVYDRRKIFGIGIPGLRGEVRRDKDGKEMTEAVQPNVLLGAAGTPSYAIRNFGNLHTLGRIAREGPGAVTGAKYFKLSQEYKKLGEEHKRGQRDAELLKAQENPADYYVNSAVAEEMDNTLEDKDDEIHWARLDPNNPDNDKFNRTVEFDEKTKERVTGKRIEDVMKEEGINPDPAFMDEQKATFFKNWDRNHTNEELGGEDGKEKLRKEARERLLKTDYADRHKNGVAMIEKKKAIDDEIEYINNGGLSNAQREEKKQELKGVETKLTRILDEIKKKQSAGMPSSAMAAEIKQEENLRKQREGLERAIKSGYQAEDKEEKEGAQKALPGLKEKSEKYADQASRVVTQTDIDEAEKNIKNKSLDMVKVAKEIRNFRPPVNFELIRDMRKAVDEKKKQLTGESWEEHLTVLEDAIKNHDLELAAAALTRATESGNENEILKMFGHKSNAAGLRQFIDEKFVKELGAGQQQALAIATDISYIAEKNRHWGVARLTKSENGKNSWADEDDRQQEVLAEIRKTDFERNMREGNRLMWGVETPGLKDLGKNASREDREEYARAGGSSEFEMEPYAIAYMAENFGRIGDSLQRGNRFNVNYAAHLNSESNKEYLDKVRAIIGNQVSKVGDKNVWTADTMLATLNNATTRQSNEGQFSTLIKLLKERGQ